MKPRIIVFDFDGVICDSMQNVLEELRRTYPEITPEIHREMGVGNWYEEMAKRNFVKIEETEEEKEHHRIEYARKKLEVPLFEGMHDLLKALHERNCVLALSTAANVANCVPILEKNGVHGLFDFIGTREVSPSKVVKFKIISEKYAVAQSDMVFVTDTLGDIREADEAGVPTIAVTWGSHDRSHFLREPHKNLLKIVDSVFELRAILEDGKMKA